MISIVIPTCNRPDLLARCLEHLAPSTQTLSAQFYEVIVTDDSDTDEAARLVYESFSWARWTAGPCRGPAANRNHGASQAKGEWLVFTDDDCLPEPGWLVAFQQAQINNIGISVFEGRVFADRPRRSLCEVSPINDKGGNLWSCNVFILCSLFKELGGFDERFPYPAMEDVELRVRLENRCQRIVFVPEAGVCHPWRRARGWKGWVRYRYSMAVFLAIHPEQRQKFTWMYYLLVVLQTLLKETLPGIVHFRGAGIGCSFITVLFFGSMAFWAALQPAWHEKLVRL